MNTYSFRLLIFTTLLLGLFSGTGELTGGFSHSHSSYFAAADFPEHYFRFRFASKSELDMLTKLISIDNVEGGYAYAYANEEQWEAFKKLGISYEELPHPGSLYDHEMNDRFMNDWNTYPTYAAYKNMMHGFAAAHPDICRLDTIGHSVQNRLLLAVKISDNVNVNEAEPEFFYTSSMHGDETVGFILTLRLADYLLSQYGQSTPEGLRATRLINNMEIWINPLANPDGTYRLGGDTTVNSATRFNANGRDLNRNFPDRINDTSNTPNGREIETQAMMRFAASRNLTMSANFHGGARVVNYPWDNGAPSGQYSACPDDNWYIEASKAYSLPNPDLMSGGFTNGITNGCQWYAVFGGRQDWIYHWYGVRETCIELWNVKNPPGSTLPARWDSNKESLLAYMEQALRGIGGIVTDSANARPVKAKILIRQYPNAFVRTDSAVGDYHRPLLAGTYDVIFTSAGYRTDTVRMVQVGDSSETRLNHTMRSLATGISSGSVIPDGYRLYAAFPNPFNPSTMIRFALPGSEHVNLTVYDIQGKTAALLVDQKIEPGIHSYEFRANGLPSGTYFCKFSAGEYIATVKLLLLK